MPPAEPMPRAEQERILKVVQDYHLHREFNYELVEAADGRARARVPVTPHHINVAGVVHGGVYYLLLDVAAYCAAVTLTPQDHNATTVDLHVNVMRPALEGQVMEMSAEVVSRTKRLMFIEAKASVEGKLVASARVTKAVVPARIGG